jgi:hypothetical protein
MRACRRTGLPGSAGLLALVERFGHTRQGYIHGALEDAWLALAAFLGIHTQLSPPRFAELAAVPPATGAAVRRCALPEVHCSPLASVTGLPVLLSPSLGVRAPGSVEPAARQPRPAPSLGGIDELLGQSERMALWDALEVVRDLKRTDRLDDALTLLMRLVERTEAEDAERGWGVAPAYYVEAAIVLRKLGRRGEEVMLLERFAGQRHAPGIGPARLLGRLQKAKAARTRRASAPCAVR